MVQACHSRPGHGAHGKRNGKKHACEQAHQHRARARYWAYFETSGFTAQWDRFINDAAIIIQIKFLFHMVAFFLFHADSPEYVQLKGYYIKPSANCQFYQSDTHAWAAMPSPAPVKPIPSSVVAFTLTASTARPQASASLSRMAAI